VGEVATEIRVLLLFETFARLKRPLRLSELANAMDMPVSSCFALVRRLLAEGHLFEPAEKRGYYPTGKLRAWTAVIAAHDPVLQRVSGVLENLRDATGETVMFGRLTGGSVVYVAALESKNSIRMAGRVGILRPCHAVAMGKALLSLLSPDERAALLKTHRFEALTPATKTSAAALEADIAEGQRRGYFITREESVEGALALGAPVFLAGEPYAIQAVGPVARVEANLERIAGLLLSAVRALGDLDGEGASI
jgi:DNA-binding IclR family transcriptional regulator